MKSAIYVKVCAVSRNSTTVSNEDIIFRWLSLNGTIEYLGDEYEIYNIVFLCICLAFIASADNDTNLRKHEGHYYLISEINNHANQEVMLESAIPGLLIGDSIFNYLFPEFDYSTARKMEKAKIALHQNIYSIDYILTKI